MVADRDNVEMVLAPPQCGASMIYRNGIYHMCLPATTRSQECLATRKLRSAAVKISKGIPITVVLFEAKEALQIGPDFQRGFRQGRLVSNHCH